MRIRNLLSHGVPPEIISLWERVHGTRLLPLQALAVKEHELFGGGNLLIQAPTSAGKTFIGEMAAVEAALNGKQVIYLAPLKALAEEKYHAFRQKYAEYGIKVIVSSRDHREFDPDLESGNFTIAVVVYEKLAQLLVRRPQRLEEIALVIADELELLSDPERGAGVEILLTRILAAQRRLIGLSAVIGEPEKLAQWMNAGLVRFEQRPVELRYGVLHNGLFRYRTCNGYAEAEEPLGPNTDATPWEVLTESIRELASRGETSLVFVKSRRESRRGAELLAETLEFPPAENAIAALEQLEPTRARQTLIQTLQNGVAFHNADLAPGERHAVEAAFRAGEIRLMVSTSTLAVGMNLPARNVFISAEKWRYDNRLGAPWKAPVLRSEYENMGGRAGRYGAGHPFGRSILIGATPFDRETLWRRYVEGPREAIHPRLADEPLEEHVLALVASAACPTEHELTAHLESTLSGHWVWRETCPLEEVETRIRCAIHRAADAGMLETGEYGALTATPLGKAVASKGITLPTAAALEAWIAASETRPWINLDLILAAALTQDGYIQGVSLSTEEYCHDRYPAQLKDLAQGLHDAAEVPFNRFRQSTAPLFFEEIRALKIALVLNGWIDGEATGTLEERYDTTAGQILAAAGQISWLIDATAAIAKAMGAPKSFLQRVARLAERVQRGLREEALPLGRLKEPPLCRTALAALVSQNLHTPEALANAPAAKLERWMSPAHARRLKRWAKNAAAQNPSAKTPPANTPTDPVLVVDGRRPGAILVDGNPVNVQEKQFRLMEILAEFPGECVPYDRIYKAVWGETVVENGQMYFQKRELLKRIRAAAPKYATIVKTIPKRGFVLNLPPAAVELRRQKVSTAA